jgi:hypothetical protein
MVVDLPAPLGPENLPSVDLKADVVHRDEVPEMPGEIFDDYGLVVCHRERCMFLAPGRTGIARLPGNLMVRSAHPT